MKTEQPQRYERLPGLGRQAVAYGTLWLGADHLLKVTTVSFTQEYRRFYFSDIQAFIVRRTNLGAIWNVVWGMPALVFAVIAMTAQDDFTRQSLGIIVGLCLAGLAVNAVRGPTCVTHIQTAVQCERLPSLCRLRNALRVVNRLERTIAAAQRIESSSPSESSLPSTAPKDDAVPPAVEGSPRPLGPGSGEADAAERGS